MSIKAGVLFRFPFLGRGGGAAPALLPPPPMPELRETTVSEDAAAREPEPWVCRCGEEVRVASNRKLHEERHGGQRPR